MRKPTIKDRIAATQRPAGSPVMYQSWRDLLFLHWEVEADSIAATLPPGIYPDLREGKAWIGLVPFFMRNIRPRFLPPVPGISNFLEMNVRTYVHDEQGRPGVWFYSLDANQALAVALAQKFFHLPYHYAKMSDDRRGETIHYRCTRSSIPSETSQFEYAAGDAMAVPEPGSFEYFLVERYYLFAHDKTKNRNLIGQVHHRPYPLHEVELGKWTGEALAQAGFPVMDREPAHVAMSKGVDVEIFPIEPV